MKIKEFFYLLGLKPKGRTYGFRLESVELERDGRIEVAQWLAPGAYPVRPTQAVVDKYREILRPGDVAIDIGAHSGDTSLPMALAVGPTGRVLALEPNPYVFPILAQNATLNPGKTSIVPLNFAAMPADGEYEFQYGGPQYNNGGYHAGMSRWRHGSAFTVKVAGKDLVAELRRNYAELLPRLRFIKVDAEGFDLGILEALEPLLVAQRPTLQVEFFSLKRSPAGYRERLYRFLDGHGYAMRRVDHGPYRDGAVVTAENLLEMNKYDVYCVPK